MLARFRIATHLRHHPRCTSRDLTVTVMSLTIAVFPRLQSDYNIRGTSKSAGISGCERNHTHGLKTKNQTAYRRTKQELAERYPAGWFVAFDDGEVVADAASFLELNLRELQSAKTVPM